MVGTQGSLPRPAVCLSSSPGRPWLTCPPNVWPSCHHRSLTGPNPERLGLSGLEPEPEPKAEPSGHTGSFHKHLSPSSGPGCVCPLPRTGRGQRQQPAPEAAQGRGLTIAHAQFISFLLFFRTCACPDVRLTWWKMSFMKLLAECHLAFLWFWKFLGT